MNFIGVNIREVDGSAPPTIVAAPTSVAGFNITTRRGVPNRPVRVDSFKAFVERFGSYFDGGIGPYLVDGLFKNGGREARINRVVSSDPDTGHAASFVTLQDSAPANTLTLRAGYRGEEDPGAWGDGLLVECAHTSPANTRLREAQTARIQAPNPLVAPVVDMTALPALTLRVDGEASDRTITFVKPDFPGGPANATPAQIRDAINGRQSAVRASLTATNELVLASTGSVAARNPAPGGWTSIQLVNANATLGFPDAVPVRQGTPSAASASGLVLRRTDGLEVGDALTITDGANTAAATVLTVNAGTGAITFTPAIAGFGGWTVEDIVVRNRRFTLRIAERKTEDEKIVETLADLSMEQDTANYVETRLNDALGGSRYLMAEDEGSASGPVANLPAETSGFIPLAKGRDGTPTATDFVGESAVGTGFFAFDAEEIQLLTAERTDPDVVVAALAYCQNRGDCMYVGATPEGLIESDLQAAIAYGQAFQGKNVYGALYGPWITVPDPAASGASPRRSIPPVGHIMGVFARIEATYNVWRAPAGDIANLAGAISVAAPLSDAAHTALVKEGTINGVRAIPRSGIVIDASRTLSTDTRWMYVNVRLLFNFLKSNLRRSMQTFRQMPNRRSLWNTIKFGTIMPFLLGLWRQGAFGTGSPDQVITVIVDETNNPPASVDAGFLNVEIYIYPSKPAETIVITVGQQPFGSATVSEV